jgi:PKHD-type hydroxylase
LQYTLYNYENNHYACHRDLGIGKQSNRKLSIVLMLSDPKDYAGGNLEIFNSGEFTSIPNKKGNVVIFPSFEWHRVLPVTSGIRKTLVAWVTGPCFR